MVGDIPQMPPQLPPLPPQPSLATPSNWKLHYPPEDINLPPSSWSALTPSQPLRRSKSTSSTSAPRQLPDSSDLVAGDSATRAGPSLVLGLPSHPKSRSHLHSRSHSRVALPVIPSASSPELMIVSPPIRTHSRGVSVGVNAGKPPTSRPSTADKDREREVLRPLPKAPRQLPPPPLPLIERVPIRDQSLSASSMGVPKSTATFPSPAIPTRASPPVILSAPPRRPLNSSPHVEAPADVQQPISATSTSPASIRTPRSAPVRRPDQEKEREREKERLRERAKSRERRKNSDHRPALMMLNPGEPFPHMHVESAPIRAPTPPRPRAASSTTRPIHSVQTSHSQQTPSSWKPQESLKGRAVVPPTPIRGPGVGVAVTLGSSPAIAVASRTVTVAPAPPSKQFKASEPPTRKWVLERKGKRLTQDSIVVAQRLRMLR